MSGWRARGSRAARTLMLRNAHACSVSVESVPHVLRLICHRDSSVTRSEPIHLEKESTERDERDIDHIPDTPCMPYMPTLTPQTTPM